MVQCPQIAIRFRREKISPNGSDSEHCDDITWKCSALSENVYIILTGSNWSTMGSFIGIINWLNNFERKGHVAESGGAER